MARGLRGLHAVDPFNEADTIDSKEMLLIICQLNKSGLNMLEYLVRNGYVYKGKFLITPKDFLEAMELRAKKSYYLGIDNLVKWDVLAKSEDVSFFYFNKNFFSWYDNNL